MLDLLYLPSEYAYLTYYPYVVSIEFIYMLSLADFIQYLADRDNFTDNVIINTVKKNNIWKI